MQEEIAEKVLILSEEISAHIIFLKTGLSFPSNLEHLGVMIDGQRDNLLANNFVGRIEELILEILQTYYSRRVYKKVKRMFESPSNTPAGRFCNLDG